MSKKKTYSPTELQAYAHGYYDGRAVGIYSRVYDGDPAEAAAYEAGFAKGEEIGRIDHLKASGEYWEDNEPDWDEDDDEDFPEHEGLDNQASAESDDGWVTVELREDLIVDPTPTVVVQIRNGMLWTMCADREVNVVLVDSDMDDEVGRTPELPEGLEMRDGMVVPASTWNQVIYQYL